MTADRLKALIAEMAAHVTFAYKGEDCGVDPLSQERFDMWCGEASITVDSIDAVMTTPFFHGQRLKDIAPAVENLDW